MPFFVIQLCWGTSDCHCGSTVRDMGVAGITTHFKTSGVLSRAVLSVSLITFHCESTNKQSTCSNDFRMVSNKGIPNASANSWISGASDTIPILSLPNLQHQSISCIHSCLELYLTLSPIVLASITSDLSVIQLGFGSWKELAYLLDRIATTETQELNQVATSSSVNAQFKHKLTWTTTHA